MENNPFSELSIDSTAFMDELGGRSQCSKCSRSRKYYCYTCYVPVPEIVSRVPRVKLPIKVDIIKHPSEVDGKSTAVHAGVIAPDDVTIYTYPCIPDYEDKSKVVLVFPGKEAVTLKDLADRWIVDKTQDDPVSLGLKRRIEVHENADSTENLCCKHSCSKRRKVQESGDESLGKVYNKECTDETEQMSNPLLLTDNKSGNGSSVVENPSSHQQCLDNKSDIADNLKSEAEGQGTGVRVNERHRLVPRCPLERVVFIDSTWNQTKTICNDERLKGLTHVELQTRKTKFWRHQKDIPDTYLSTIEAIYYFLCDFHEQFVQSEYSGQYDNLLFFFTYMYSKIRCLYNGGEDLRAYKSRKGN